MVVFCHDDLWLGDEPLAPQLAQALERFDPTFPFHLYDLDFCRSAEQAGLRLGVWPLDLIHASGSAAFTQSWKACGLLYRQKWEPPTLETGGANPDALQWQSAIAGAHQVLKQWPQALAAYDAVLDQEPEQLEPLISRAWCSTSSSAAPRPSPASMPP